MYKIREQSYFFIAILYWIIYMLGFVVMGILYKNNVTNYNLVYYFLFFLGILIVTIKDKSIVNLGFSRDNLKNNVLISIGIIFITFAISILVSHYPLLTLLKKTVYYLFYISLVEEVVYRGIIQNYLFGLKAKKYLIYVIGALFFSLMHLPFQMYIHNNVSLTYIVNAIPQLVFTFLFYLLMCFITYMRKDIAIPIALHFAIDYMQAIM